MDLKTRLKALAQGLPEDPFALLGPHPSEKGKMIVRILKPDANEVNVHSGGQMFEASRLLPEGLFQATIPGEFWDPAYSVQSKRDGTVRKTRDPYSFWPLVDELDRHLIGEGRHLEIFRHLGAHIRNVNGCTGTLFAVWAPNARRVAVVGPFNEWDTRHHPMRRHPGCGVWELFIPDLGEGTLYKFAVLPSEGPESYRIDPMGSYFEQPPGNAAIVCNIESFPWEDDDWMAERKKFDPSKAPISVYECHTGSWMRHPDGRFYSYTELAEKLPAYLHEMGFTHVEFLPVSEHPFYGSWGYQTTGYFAPTSRYGPPADFMKLVQALHRENIGVIIDWVPAHFPGDTWGLARYDGTCLYEHADPRQGEHPDWGTKVFNFGRNEIRNFLISNAIFWCRQYHIDGLRVDAVASMLYLDYSRRDGQWIPNRYGGRENLEAITFLQEMNQTLRNSCPGIMTIAEESTDWGGVTRSTEQGGLGFDFKWNMGWMHDTLAYMHLDPLYRSYHHDLMTFSLLYAFSEQFQLALSHDEVVHLKGSLWGKMPGDDWRKAAQLRLLFSTIIAHPGKKLLFMGSELGQTGEWNHDSELEWGCLQDPLHAGIQSCLQDLNRIYRETPALWELDERGWKGFCWIDPNDRGSSVLSWLRFDRHGGPLAFVGNFTPIPRQGYRIGVPRPGNWREIVNTDSAYYGGSNVGNGGIVQASTVPHGEFSWSLQLDLPPLGGLMLVPEPERESPSSSAEEV